AGLLGAFLLSSDAEAGPLRKNKCGDPCAAPAAPCAPSCAPKRPKMPKLGCFKKKPKCEPCATPCATAYAAPCSPCGTSYGPAPPGQATPQAPTKAMSM